MTSSTSPKAIIFLDVDGTLINSYSGVNIKDPQRYFKKYQEKGLLLSLNSNRSIEDLIPIFQEFNLIGPIIGENGAFVYFPDAKSVKTFISPKDKGIMSEVKQKLPNIIKDFFEAKSIKYKWINTDTVKYLRKKRFNKLASGTILILNNEYRKYTSSSHLKILKENRLLPASEIIKPLTKYIQKELSPYSKVDVNFHPQYCNILIQSSAVSKRTGVKTLKKIFPRIPIYAIGDEITDHKMIDGLGAFFTVANANKEVKALASYVSKYKYTQGVIDIIQSILDNHQA